MLDNIVGQLVYTFLVEFKMNRNIHLQIHGFMPGQTFETQYLNTNYFTFRSLFGHKFGLRNDLEDIKVFDMIFEAN